MCDDNEFFQLENNYEDGVATPESYELDNYTAFRSMLNITRNQDREKNVCKALNPPYRIIDPPREIDECQTDSGSHASTIALARATLQENKKKRECANKLYSEFLNYKRDLIQNTRLEKFRQFGVPCDKLPEKVTKHYSLDEPKRHTDENQSCGGVNYFDKTISSLLVASEKPKPKIEEKEENPCDLKWDDSEIPIQPILSPQNESLVEDQYFPGFIDDAVKGKIDFNQIAFHISFGGDGIPTEDPTPEEIPISLIEAFDLRVQREQSKLQKTLQTEEVSILKRNISAADCGSRTNILCREEIVLANSIVIDLDNIMKNRPMTDLTKAIACLQRAEIMNDFNKSFQAAEEAFEAACPDMAEKAAISKARTFKAEEIYKKKITLPAEARYRPIEVVSYLGITKPIEPIVKCGEESD